MSHYLITDGQGTCAAEIEKRTGLRAHDTALGILVEKRKPFDMQGALAQIDRALHPSRCICGRYAVLHQPNCPEAWAVT
jgi:hypothetical protein